MSAEEKSIGAQMRLLEERDRFRKALVEAREVLALCNSGGDFDVPENAPVLVLCLEHGFGAVMAAAARQWATYGDLGDIGAHTCGPCRQTVKVTLEAIDVALQDEEKR